MEYARTVQTTRHVKIQTAAQIREAVILTAAIMDAVPVVHAFSPPLGLTVNSGMPLIGGCVS